jgi:hypothetical protein
MKYLHAILGLFYIIYAAINFSHLGIGEWLTIAVSLGGLLYARFVCKRDLTGMYLAGMLMGLMVEYITAAYWHYSLKVFVWPNARIWGDISLFVVLGWGYSFTMFVLFSNWLFRKTTHLPLTSPWIILFDAVLAPFWFVPYELLGMHVLHLWEYTPCSGWNTIIPVIDYPVEGVVGSILFGLVLPSFVRHWGEKLKVTRKLPS